ncbi:MAG: UxaA family hydrolase [Sulfolobales archaeon]
MGNSSHGQASRADAIIHCRGDNVAVAIRDISRGESIKIVYIDDLQLGYIITVRDDIPLGHKVALRRIAKGERIIKYDKPIGYAVDDIPEGSHVHIHNLRSLRWGSKKIQREMI